MSHAIEGPTFERNDARGALVEIRNRGPWGAVLWGAMRAGAVIGNHYHRRTAVYLHVLRGGARVATIDVASGARDAFEVPPGRGVLLGPGVSHAIRFTSDSEYLLLKSQPYDAADPDTFPFPVPDGTP
jgi:quercetin dioxygenase-like cupin family protein